MPELSLRVRVKCLRRLCRTCGYHGILPEASKISISYDRTADPKYSGGFADVWKVEYCGRDVAVKALRTYTGSDRQKTHGVSCSPSTYNKR